MIKAKMKLLAMVVTVLGISGSSSVSFSSAKNFSSIGAISFAQNYSGPALV